VTCPSCDRFAEAERASIEGRDVVPPHELDGCTCNVEPLIAMTLLGPERLPLAPQRGLGLGVTWAELVRWIGEPIVTADKASAGGFVLAKLGNGIRRKCHVESVSALALESDSGKMTPEAAHERLHKYRHVIYSTASSTPEHPRWRAILETSRPMLPDEHAIVWARAAQVIERDAPVDGACKDPCRLWYTPTVRPGAVHTVLTGEGAPVDVESVLANASAARAKARTTAPSTPRPEHGDRYIDAALTRECNNVASAPDGARNVALNRATYALARFHIPNIEITEALLRAAISAGLPELEARKTIASALKARRGQA
jgi:hypothetical protein